MPSIGFYRNTHTHTHTDTHTHTHTHTHTSDQEEGIVARNFAKGSSPVIPLKIIGTFAPLIGIAALPSTHMVARKRSLDIRAHANLENKSSLGLSPVRVKNVPSCSQTVACLGYYRFGSKFVFLRLLIVLDFRDF